MKPDAHIETETKVYTSEDGHAVIEQPAGSVRLSAEDILAVIRELQACYDYCAAWRQSAQE
ncbi:MAG: hypothetical protein GX535_06840 [Xanthomonadaceae bacterium]|nr:hypothetical protein [Xanthomonadaceae bacterium]